MTKKTVLIWNVLLIILLCSIDSCKSKNSQQTDPKAVLRGEKVFNQNCTSCHSATKDGIGPALGGLTAVVTDEWIKKFIKDPKAMIESGDERSVLRYKKYKTYMPPYSMYTDNDLNDLVAFLHTQKTPPGKDII